MKRAILAGVSLAVLAACGSPPPEKVAQAKPSLVQPNCPTVRPFKPLKFRKPASAVPDAFRAFAGLWGGGAWDGRVCHDLYVLKVDDEGAVELFDAHGPGFGFDATGFARKGKIDENGHLVVRKGPAMVEYWIEDGRLHGLRRMGKVKSKIILSRQS